MTTRRQVPRASISTFGTTPLFEGEIAYDETMRRFRMGDGTTPAGQLVATISDTAGGIRPLPGFYGQITGGTNPGNSYELTIDGAILLRPKDGDLMEVRGFNDYCRFTEARSARGGIRGRDTETALSAHEQGYVYLCGNKSSGYACLIASQAESYLNVSTPVGYDYIVPYPAAWYITDVGTNLRNIAIYGRRHTYIKHLDGNTQPIIASGAQGDPVEGTYVSVSLAAYLPKQAHHATLTVYGQNGVTKFAPDPDYDTGGGVGGRGIPYQVSTRKASQSIQVRLLIEDYYDRAVFYASNDPSATLSLYDFTLSFGNIVG